MKLFPQIACISLLGQEIEGNAAVRASNSDALVPPSAVNWLANITLVNRRITKAIYASFIFLALSHNIIIGQSTDLVLTAKRGNT